MYHIYVENYDKANATVHRLTKHKTLGPLFAARLESSAECNPSQLLSALIKPVQQVRFMALAVGLDPIGSGGSALRTIMALHGSVKQPRYEGGLRVLTRDR